MIFTGRAQILIGPKASHKSIETPNSFKEKLYRGNKSNEMKLSMTYLFYAIRHFASSGVKQMNSPVEVKCFMFPSEVKSQKLHI